MIGKSNECQETYFVPSLLQVLVLPPLLLLTFQSPQVVVYVFWPEISIVMNERNGLKQVIIMIVLVPCHLLPYGSLLNKRNESVRMWKIYETSEPLLNDLI